MFYIMFVSRLFFDNSEHKGSIVSFTIYIEITYFEYIGSAEILTLINI